MNATRNGVTDGKHNEVKPSAHVHELSKDGQAHQDHSMAQICGVTPRQHFQPSHVED